MRNYDYRKRTGEFFLLYHYERKWGTMVFAPMPKNDFPHIISPFSACVNPQREEAGGAGCPGGALAYT